MNRNGSRRRAMCRPARCPTKDSVLTLIHPLLVVTVEPRQSLTNAGRTAPAENVHLFRQHCYNPPLPGSQQLQSAFLSEVLVRANSIGLGPGSVSYTHLRAHETRHDLVC